jgi:hypothetical protein
MLALMGAKSPTRVWYHINAADQTGSAAISELMSFEFSQ